jgi:putative transposase
MTMYHVWFSTKRRLPALQGEIDDFVNATMHEVASRWEISIVEMQTAFDHVHLLIDVRTGQTLPSVMHQLKGATARAVFLEFPDLRMDMESNSFWQKSYGARFIPPKQVSAVRQYIRSQPERPLRHGDA